MIAPRVHRGAGLRGLRPAPGDEVLVDGEVLPGVDHVRWYRVSQIRDPQSGGLELRGWLIPRGDLGEQWPSPPITLYVAQPARLIVRRAPGGTVPPGPPPVRLAGPVEQLLEMPPERPTLPPGVVAALGDPDDRRYTAAGLPRREPLMGNKPPPPPPPRPACPACGHHQYHSLGCPMAPGNKK